MMQLKLNGVVWILVFLISVVAILSLIAASVVRIDPFFHYREPQVDKYYYYLNNERSQNNGIVKHFTYDAIVTGTSMTENFRTSEIDRLFGVKAIKTPFSGGTFKEINDNLSVALKNNSDVRMIIRGIDIGKMFDDKDFMRTDLGEFPTYLYDDNILNDVKYVFNRDVVFDRVYPMIWDSKQRESVKGITSFDEYANWMSGYTFGLNSVRPDGVMDLKAGEPIYLTKEEKDELIASIEQNILRLPQEYPDVEFYYFFTPYSALFWQDMNTQGIIYKIVEAEEIICQTVLGYENIKLFSFNCMTEITTDLNNYKDDTHYGVWINDLIVQYMREEKCLLTEENYKKQFEKELAFYTTFDYVTLNKQEDYEDDYEAKRKLYQNVVQ